MTVMILTRSFDPTSDWVVEELNRRGVPLFRCDVSEFPIELSISATLDHEWSGTLRSRQRSLELEEITGIYYRRPTSFVFPEHMNQADREWAATEAKLGFLGTLSAVPRWLNHPSCIAHAEYKPLQLQLAKQNGLTVPKTLITNRTEDALSFARHVGEVVYKPFSPRGVVGADGRRRLIFTRRLQADELDNPGLGLTTHMLQEWVTHTHAVRMTVVDDVFFAAEIHSHSQEAETDWRSDYGSLSYAPTTVPENIESMVASLMRDFGLRFGALDFLVTGNGEWVFLEINPNGQWAWIEQLAPDIASALADALEKGPCLD